VLAAVFDGVHQQFAEGGGDVFAILGREVAFQFADEVGGAICRLDFAPDLQGDPLGEGGNQADIALPGIRAERLGDHIGEGGGGQRLVEVAVGVLADGVHDEFRVARAGNDNLGFRPDGVDAP
jgi:hypothetical protein